MRISYILLTLVCFQLSFAQVKTTSFLPSVDPVVVGFNQDSLNILDDSISNFEQRDYRGLVVIKDQKLAIEYYYNSFWRNHIHDIRSAGKSITAILVGVALQEGLIDHLEQDVYSFFPKDKYPTIHEDFKQVKLIHLLNMTSGLDADSDDNRTPGNASKWMAKDDWLSYILSIPLTRKPGLKWVYADINAVLLGAIIECTSGKSLRDFAQEKVFDPMGINEFYWYTNASDQTGAAGNLYLSTLDFAKLGLMVANEGRWGDVQLADADYIQKLLSAHSDLIGDYNPLADGYGMLWYRSTRSFGSKEVSYRWASGNGGNFLIVIPDENMVIATTSGAYGQWYPHLRAYFILGKVIQALE